MDSPEFQKWKDAELQLYLKGTPWKVYQTDKGKPYYYQKVTKVTQWTKPEDIKAFEDTLTIEQFKTSLKPQQQSIASPVVQPKVVKVLSKEELELLLERRDSILEPKAADTAKALQEQHNVSKEQIVDKLASNYSGYPAMTRMLVEWIKLAHILQETTPANATSYGTTTASNMVLSGSAKAKVEYFGSDAFGDEVIAPYLSELVKLRFNKKAADALVNTPEASAARNKNSHSSSVLPVLPSYVHTLAQNPAYKEAFQDLFKVQEQSTLLKAICTGAYTTSSNSDVNGDSKHSVSDGTASREQIFAALCVEVDLFEQIDSMVNSFADSVKSGDTTEAAVIQTKIVTIVQTSTEVVKYFTLQLLRSKKDSSLVQDSQQTSEVTIDAAQSRKRPRSDDGVEAGDGSSTSDTKRVRVDDGGTSSSSSSDHTSVSQSKDSKTNTLSALDALYNAVLHSEGSTTTTDLSSNAKKNNAVEPSTQVLHRIVEKMVATHEASAEGVMQLFELYFKPSTAHQDSAELNRQHPSISYCLHPLVQQMLVTLLVCSITDKTAEIGEEDASLLRSRLYSLLSISTESSEVMLVTVQRLEEALTLCYEIQDTFYGVMDETKCAYLISLAQGCPVCARLIVAWITYHTLDKANTSNVDFVSVLPTMCGWVKAAAEGHPVLLEACLGAAKAVLSAAQSILTAGEHEAVAKVSLLTEQVTVAQRAGLELCVQLIVAGYSKHTLLYLIRAVELLDVEMVRVLLHSVLEVNNLSSLFPTAAPASLLVKLFSTDSSLRALNSQHFDRADIDKLALVLEHISSLDALSTETQVQCADLLVLCRR